VFQDAATGPETASLAVQPRQRLCNSTSPETIMPSHILLWAQSDVLQPWGKREVTFGMAASGEKVKTRSAVYAIQSGLLQIFSATLLGRAAD